MIFQDLSACFPEARPDDLCLTFGLFKPGELPLKQAAIKTETGFETLTASMMDLGAGILLSVQSERCSDKHMVFRPLDQRKDELEDYRKRGCQFRRNGDPNSNFFTVAAAGDGVIWIRNEGDRSLRFQTPDQTIYRVCTGYTEALAPGNTQAQISPTQILLDLHGNPLDLRIGAAYVKYGDRPCQRAGVSILSPGDQVGSSFCRIFCGDDCLGVLSSYSHYFLERPQLEILDISSYGPSLWFVRNRGESPLSLIWPDRGRHGVPADGRIYSFAALAAHREERDE